MITYSQVIRQFVFLGIIFFSFTRLLIAQEIKLQGIVQDSIGQPLAFASILAKPEIKTESVAFAQYQSGKVVYKVIPPETLIEFRDTTKTRTEPGKRAAVRSYNSLKANASSLSLIMTFNTKEAVAKMPATMEIGNHSDLHSAAINAKFHRKYYTKIEESYQLHDFELAGREWLVRYDRDISSWKITNETKEIHGYTCYKTTTPIKINGEEIEENLEAWFTPEIPFRYGPMEIYGLPGLILEVRQRNFIYYATEIELYKKANDIKIPKRKPILHTEYHGEMKKMRDAFKQ